MLQRLSSLFPGHGGAEVWRPRYWFLAAAPVIALYLLELVKITSFEVMRAPNAGLGVQLSMMLVFFAAWAMVPRGVWTLLSRMEKAARFNRLGPKAAVLGFAGLAMSAAHLLILALFLRILYSPPGWTVSHLFHSFSEVWVGYAGFWFVLYALACLIILAVRWKPQPPPARIELSRNGMSHAIGFSEIYWIEARGNYVELHTARGVYTLRKSLAVIAREVGEGFIQSHRSALVNAAHVRAIEPSGGHDSYRVTLASGASAPLSRRRLSEFRSLLKRQPLA